jgi:transposase
MGTATLITVARRRRFSLEEKQALIVSAFGPGGSVARTARQAEVCTSLLYRWRRRMELHGSEGPGFAPVVVKSSASASSALCDPAVVVELAVGARVSVGAGAPASLVSAILQALR